MPAKSKKQYNLMQAVCSGSLKIPGLSKRTACEYVQGQSPKGLPRRSRKKS